MKIFKTIGNFCLAAVALTMVMSCSDDNGGGNEWTGRPQKERKDIVLTRSEQQIVDGHTKFSFDFFRQVNNGQQDIYSQSQDKASENVIISPLSVAIDLSMLANATDDEFYNEFLKLMDLNPAVTRSEMNDLCRLLMDELVDIDSQVDLKIANSIWTTKEATVKDAFSKEVTEKYKAFCQSVDFESQETVEIMNKWVSEATSGHITSIHYIPSELLSGRMLTAKICNALYFNGEWFTKFNKDKTTVKPFNNIDRTKSDVPMMNGKTPVRFLQDADRTVIGVPIGNRAYSLYFIVPDKETDFNTNIASIDYETWNTYLEGSMEKRLTLFIPKFEFDYRLDVWKTLSSMGLDFDTEARPFNIPNMFEEKEFSDGQTIDIDQNCTFKVDENGATATTATTSTSGLFMADIVESFVIDRPFMFLIEEQSTGAILFMGKVVKL